MASENIDGVNPDFLAGKLGRGYVNALAAVQTPTLPGIRVKRWSLEDSGGDGQITSGEQVTVTIMLVNYLAPAQQVSVGLMDESQLAFINNLESEVQVGSLNSGDSTEVSFMLEVAANAPKDTLVRLFTRIRAAGGFEDTPDRLELHVNRNRSVGLLFDGFRALYTATDGDHWDDNTNWDITTVPSYDELMQWHGVMAINGSIYGLDLTENGLNGYVPAELGNLSPLTYLSLRQNSLSGTIPPELGNLSNLERFSLGDNALSGPIPPELANLSKMKALVLRTNQLSGTIPPWFGSFQDLFMLILAENSLSGTIPLELGNLSKLRYLFLHDNSLSGPIPSELGSLLKLEELILRDNSLSGPIPSELGKLSSLGYLSLESNSLSGTIPSELGNLNSLDYLSLRKNLLSGAVPPELGNLSNLTYLYLQKNALTGMLPRSFLSLTNLQLFQFHGQELCAPKDDEFQAWLSSIPEVLGPTCGEVQLTGHIDSQTFAVGEAVAALVLPEATGGTVPYAYALTPSLPAGLVFDDSTRTLSGVPSAISPKRSYYYSVTDSAGSSAGVWFVIEIVSSVDVEREITPESIVMHGNYPNPFQQSTRLVFDLPLPASVRIEVMDMTGRRVLTVPPVRLAAGREHSIELLGATLSSGQYLYRLIATSAEGTSTHVGSFVRLR